MHHFFINFGVMVLCIIGFVSWWKEPELTDEEVAAAKDQSDEEWARSPFNKTSPYYRYKNDENRY
jgi:hypothetical protein